MHIFFESDSLKRLLRWTFLYALEWATAHVGGRTECGPAPQCLIMSS